MLTISLYVVGFAAPGSSLRHRLFKLFNPGSDAYVVDLPQDEEKPYYDEKRKIWVFPGDNPDELVKPIAPPPTMPTTTPSTPAPEPSTSNDPLAAMMAPPSRGPSSMKRPGLGGTPRGYPGSMPGFGGGPPGSAPPSAGGPPPQFAVFQPKPTPKEEPKSED
jgi:hypothetical protein